MLSKEDFYSILENPKNSVKYFIVVGNKEIMLDENYLDLKLDVMSLNELDYETLFNYFNLAYCFP